MTVDQFYHMPSQGLGTEFTDSSRPLSFATTYTNRFRNTTGGSERRPGMDLFSPQVPGNPNLTRLHEFVDNFGNETLMSSDDFGNIYSFNASADTWANVRTGGAADRYISGEAEGKLIFVNGVDRNQYTSDGQTFNELKALITTGVLAAGSSAAVVVDGNISNWIGGTLVSNNDIVHNVTLNAYGIVSTIASAKLGITPIGISSNGAGVASRDQAPGDAYELVDYVDLNIIPKGATNVQDGLPLDNVGTATSGTTVSVIAVSGVNFATTEVRFGDFVYNTTRGAISQVGSVSANINLQQPVSAQIAGDALAFFKSAMPIASWVHVHYGRTYLLDSRNNNRIVITAPDDPQDVTTFQNTLDATSFSFGSQQPSADVLLSMGTFLSYFVAAGEKNLYVYQGNTPIQDTSQTALNFVPIAFYPNGIASRFGIASDGGTLMHITVDGLQTVNIGYNAFGTVQNNASVPIRSTLRNAILNITDTDDIQLTYYPRRNWLINKIGDQCFVLNAIPSYDQTGQQIPISSWHLYTGTWAQQNHYFVRRNGDLLSCGPNGFVYSMDSSAATDNGQVISTQLTTAWLRLEEPQYTPRIKTGQYIKPLFESGTGIDYTITAKAGFDGFSADSINVPVFGGGAIGSFVIGTTQIGQGFNVFDQKYPLVWRGEQAQISFITESSASPDVITGFTIYGAIGGRR